MSSARKKTNSKHSLSKAMHFFPKKHLIIIASLACLLALHSALSLPTTTTRSNDSLVLDISSPTTPEKTSPPNSSPIADWKTVTVKSGDSLSIIFSRLGISHNSLQQLITDIQENKQLLSIHPGQQLFFLQRGNKLIGLRYKKSQLTSIEINYNEEKKQFISKKHSITPERYTAFREVSITSSLFLAGTRAGLEEDLIMELAGIFGWDIDFALDIRTSDSFKILYEELFVDGEKVGNGPILAAEFTNQGRSYHAVRYTNSYGESAYYTPEGRSMKKAFLRTPVDFARISSHFNLKRKHPILNRIRAHKGTDYAAPTGTPIKAAGNGKVEFAGTKRGYGRTVILRHGQSYKTLYAHMHKFARNIKAGKRVRQGEVIGYVGKSGLATGPHLHYEFYKNGVVRNPVKVELPKAESISRQTLSDFKKQTQPYVAQIKDLTQKNQLAQKP